MRRDRMISVGVLAGCMVVCTAQAYVLAATPARIGPFAASVWCMAGACVMGLAALVILLGED